ncbi:MAG: methyltransferase regulatory domain-containing protein [Acidobacteria bacterium]|nr:methyltransferase regulatory domain-containing protein [Acidobacteriota bacterium]
MAAHGYVTDTSYTDQFFRELAPAWLNYVAALNGAQPVAIEQPFVYLELGCGFGTSTVVNAGAYPQGAFHGCDIIPAHLDGGRRHAAAFGVGNVTFHEADFGQLLARDLPRCDFIVLHGVYSWVDDEARAAVRRVIDDRLKPGGLVYISYNCLPGWASEAPLRKLLVEFSRSHDGDTAQRTAAALDALTAFSRARPRYFNANPSALTAVEAWRKRDTEYVVHEFMNAAWQPFYAVDVADELAPIGLRYVGSATLADNHPPLVLDAESAKAVAALDTDRQRQLATDFATNQRFRRDVFVRDDDARGRSASRSGERLFATVIGTARAPSGIGVRAAVPRGEIGFHDGFIRDVRALMARGSLPIADAVASLSQHGGNPEEIARNLIFLVAAGVLIPFARAHAVRDRAPNRQPRATRMLERAIACATGEQKGCTVPSEIMGNGFPLEPGEARAVQAVLSGAAPDDTTRELLATLERIGLLE